MVMGRPSLGFFEASAAFRAPSVCPISTLDGSAATPEMGGCKKLSRAVLNVRDEKSQVVYPNSVNGGEHRKMEVTGTVGCRGALSVATLPHE